MTEPGPAEPVVRPLPQPSISSEPFWVSGADGRLRIAQCQACRRYHHPPQPICSQCRSLDVVLTPVSGRATVAGFTVNHQQWLPRFAPPYVVAVVAIAEDPATRLTTNIVGCDPGDVAIGMQVRVVFEQHDAVWIPLFEPDPEASGTGQVPGPRDLTSAVRAMVSSSKFEDKVALTGVGSSTIGRRLMVDPLSLTVTACLRAVEDAGLTLADIDGLATYPGGLAGGMSEGGITAVEEALRLQPTWISGGGEVPGPSGSVVSAMLAVAAGLCRHVLCFRTVWESTHTALARAATPRAGGSRGASGMFEWRAPFGAMSAANWIGVNASHYFWRYGGDRASTLAPIALTARANAIRNPAAIYRDPLSLEDYLSARMISSPFGLYDCDVPCDGAIAVIVSSIDTAADRPKPPVLVEAVGTQVVDRISWDQDTLTHEPQVFGPAAHLWTRTELRPDDVDVAELYDGFTFNAVSWLEALGFCGLGEAADFLDGGATIALDGKLPLNTHGGQLSGGRTHGFGFLAEAIAQLRGEAADRQVDGAQVAVVTTGGGTPGGALLLRRDS